MASTTTAKSTEPVIRLCVQSSFPGDNGLAADPLARFCRLIPVSRFGRCLIGDVASRAQLIITTGAEPSGNEQRTDAIDP